MSLPHRLFRPALSIASALAALGATLSNPLFAQAPAAPPPGASILVPEPDESDNAATVKRAKQVRVECDAPEIRAGFVNLTDGIQREFRQMLHETDEDWLTPLEVIVTGTPSDVVSGATAAMEFKLHADGTFQLLLHVRLHNRYDPDEVRRRFIELMLTELMVRPYVGKPESFKASKLEAPFWLVQGVDMLLEYRNNGRPSELFAGMVGSRRILPIEEILRQNRSSAPSDPVTTALYDASSAALVAALIDQDTGGGSRNLKAYLGDLPSAAPDNAETDGSRLRRHFPTLRGSAGALEKWWSLQVASMGQSQALEYFSVEKTEALLDEALAIEVAADPPREKGPIRKLLPQARPKGHFVGRLHDFESFMGHANAGTALEACHRRLRLLGLKAFPLYQGIILRYESVTTNLLGEKPRGLQKELESLDRERIAIRNAMSRVDDYMNYIEATESEGRSEAYEQYREMKKKLDQGGAPPKTDRITKYLDALEREFSSP